MNVMIEAIMKIIEMKATFTHLTPNMVYSILKYIERLGLFYSSLLSKYRRHDHSTDQTIIDIFDKGLSNQDISSIVNHLCCASYSKQTVSNITDK